jgi:hypothetical protein
MGMHWLGYDIGKVGKNTFVVPVQVNYVETNTPKYGVFCIFPRKTQSVKLSPLELLLSLSECCLRYASVLR